MSHHSWRRVTPIRQGWRVQWKLEEVQMKGKILCPAELPQVSYFSLI